MILGAGIGGVATAVALREALGPDHIIELVDRRSEFAFGFRKLSAFLGGSSWEEGARPLSALGSKGIELIQGEIEQIEPAERAAVVDGERRVADVLVLALGARPNPGAVPGFMDNGVTFYVPDKLVEGSTALRAFDGGRVVLAVLGVPYPCPPAPYEAALLLHEQFEARGTDATVSVYSPLPMSLPVLGDAGCSVIEGRLEQHGVRFTPNSAPVRVEPGRILFTTGPVDFDLLIGVPAHSCPEVVARAGLTGDSGWVEPDPSTLETGHEGVYALGDMVSIPLADGKKLPKAGVLAEAQGQVVAARIAARLDGREPDSIYEGRGHCFLEVGDGQAMLVRGHFLAEPVPVVEVLGPSAEHLQAKHDWERSRLEAWFGQ